MYKRILLATDETNESLVALREGALIARRFGAQAFLLVVNIRSTGAIMADGIYPAPRSDEPARLLEVGLTRLRRLGVRASGAVVTGEPVTEIGIAARNFNADLIVVGHKKQSLLDRWWSRSAGHYIVDQSQCSVLIARNDISDLEFERQMTAYRTLADA